jgi:hypothetical protein
MPGNVRINVRNAAGGILCSTTGSGGASPRLEVGCTTALSLHLFRDVMHQDFPVFTTSRHNRTRKTPWLRLEMFPHEGCLQLVYSRSQIIRSQSLKDRQASRFSFRNSPRIVCRVLKDNKLQTMKALFKGLMLRGAHTSHYLPLPSTERQCYENSTSCGQRKMRPATNTSICALHGIGTEHFI